MQNAAHENQPQPENSDECTAYVFLGSMTILGLGIGMLIYYAENSAMGSLCREPIYLIFLPTSFYLQVVPLFFMLELILQLYPFEVTLLQKSGFHFFWLWILLEAFSIQAGLNLGASLMFPSNCGSEVKSKGPYITFWVVTGLNLLLLLGSILGHIGFAVDYCEDKTDFYHSNSLGPWFDRKKRARVLRQLVRCAGTKEGCRLLAKQYCDDLFKWKDCFDHPIVLEYIWNTCEVRVSAEQALTNCLTCNQPLRYKERAFASKLLQNQLHHLSCAKRWGSTKMDQLFPKPADLVRSLEELTTLTQPSNSK